MGKNLAIIIGCSNYQAVESLEFVCKDIELMRSAFSLYCNCEEEDIITIANEASSETVYISSHIIHERLMQLIDERKDQYYDNVYFYFSGHGTSDKKLFLLCEDFNPQFARGMLSLEDSIIKYLQNINSKYYFLFLDTCRETISTQEETGHLFDLPPNMVVFFSCSIGQYSRSLLNRQASAYTFFLNKAFSDNQIPCDVEGFSKALERMIKDEEGEFTNQIPNTVSHGTLSLHEANIKYNCSTIPTSVSYTTSFSRKTCAYWVNTGQDNGKPWIDDRYKVALIDYFLIMKNYCLFILIHPYGHDLIHTLNENVNKLPTNMRWTDNESVDSALGRICFFDNYKPDVERISKAIEKWIVDEQTYQLIISIPSDNPGALSHAKNITTYLSNKKSCVHYQVLSMESPYSLSKQHTLGRLHCSSINENILCNELFDKIHQDLRILSMLYSSWINADNTKKIRVLEIASNSLSAMDYVISKIDITELTVLLSANESYSFSINWDIIVFYIYCLIKGGQEKWYDLYEMLKERCSDDLYTFLNNDSHVLQKNIWSIIYKLQSEKGKDALSGIRKKGTPLYYKYLLGTEFADKDRLEEFVGDPVSQRRLRDLFVRKDSCLTFLLPDFMR